MQVIREKNCQVVKLTAIFPTGRCYEAKRALAQAFCAMMRKGTNSKTNAVLQREIDRYALSIDIYASPLFITAEVSFHQRFFDSAAEIFIEILFQAKFSDIQWSIVKCQLIENLIQQRNQTDYWADKILSESVLGEQSPLGYFTSPEDYSKISVQDIQDFYCKYFLKSNPSWFLAGAVAKENEITLNRVLSYLDIQKEIKNISIPVLTNLAPNLHTMKVEGASQASIRLGKVIPRASFQEFMTLEIWNTYLGGYYMSELMKSLRIEKGYTYGVYSYLIHFPKFSFFQIAYETDKINADKSLEEINRTFKRLMGEERIDLLEARKQYFSQWSKNSERSLQEISYKIKMHKLGYSYSQYKNQIRDYETAIPSVDGHLKSSLLNFESYTKVMVS